MVTTKWLRWTMMIMIRTRNKKETNNYKSYRNWILECRTWLNSYLITEWWIVIWRRLVMMRRGYHWASLGKGPLLKGIIRWIDCLLWSMISRKNPLKRKRKLISLVDCFISVYRMTLDIWICKHLYSILLKRLKKNFRSSLLYNKFKSTTP